ncbi:TonB-dependent receptor [Erythrobacter crassostreae]|nr:TonB-dependent receptor [Erythrobacter crassostrea]
MPTAAFAQDAEQPTAEEAEGVIIVTATRRAQDVQEIPIAVTAVNQVQLDRQGVVNVQNLTQVSPSFSTSQAQNSSGTVVLRIRGVGTTSNNIGFESAVGIFVDGAYQSRPGIALSEFVDIERVEVLRGPQGTLFGRNTSAGALNITTKRPELDSVGGFVNATYGNFEHMNVQGAVNIPIVEDSVAVRFAGAYRKRDGFVTVLDRNGDFLQDTNSVDQFLVRGQIGWETDSGFRGRIIGDYSESSGDCCGSVELLQSPVESNGLFNFVTLGARGGMSAPVVATSPFDQTTAEQALDNRIATADTLHLAASNQWGVTADLEFPISDSVDLFYVGSYRQYTNDESYDSDFSGLDVFNVLPGSVTDIDTMTHELRLQGEAFSGALQWMIGGYYSEEEITQSVNFGLGEDYGELIGALLFAPTNGGFGANPLTVLSGGVDPSVVRATNRYTQDSTSWSIFTHNTLEITNGLDLTLGLRYSDESKDGSFTQPSVNNLLCPAILGSIGAGNVPGPLINTIFGTGCFAFTAPAIGSDANPFPLPRPFDTNFEDDELIYTVKLGYEFAAPVNVYAAFTHGYKAGGFNLDSTAAAGGADPRFDSEVVDSYEIGMKARMLDDAITTNIAAFYQEFTNFQVLEFTGAQFQTFNVPLAISKGFELETVIRPTDGLTINGGVTYVDASYPSDCAATTDALRVQNLCGNELTNAPQLVSLLGATYTQDIGDSLTFFLNGQARIESDRRTSTQARAVPTTAADLGTTALLPFDVQDGNVKINLRAGIGDIDDAWTVEAWVTNLTDEVTRGVTFNTVLRSGSRSAFTQQPRMYGVTLRGQF